MPKPEMLIPHLERLRVDPQATRHFEIMSGGFFWSDERLGVSYSEGAGGYAMRFLLGYRASLVRGQPREDLRSVWECVLAACPQWPGFLPERRSPTLADDLTRSSQSALRSLESLDRVCSRERSKRAMAAKANFPLQQIELGRSVWSRLRRVFSHLSRQITKD